MPKALLVQLTLPVAAAVDGLLMVMVTAAVTDGKPGDEAMRMTVNLLELDTTALHVVP